MDRYPVRHALAADGVSQETRDERLEVGSGRGVPDLLARRVARPTAIAIAGMVAVGLAQAADALTFAAMNQAGLLHHEQNPLVAAGALRLGVPILLVAKVALVILVVSIAGILAREQAWLAAVVLTAGMIAGLIGAYSNVLVLI